MGLEKINEIRKAKNLSIDELCERSGIPKSTISKITAGITTNPTLDTIQAIARALGCRLDDFDDTPRPVKNAPSELSEEAKKIAKDFDKLTDHGKGAVRAILGYEEKALAHHIKQEDEDGKIITLPTSKRNGHGFIENKVYNQPAAAGLGNYLDEPGYRVEQYPPKVIPSKTDFGVIISGDSMEPKIHDGGTVFVRAMPAIDPGQIGIFVLDGKAFCKKLMVDQINRQIHLVSLNPEYEDIIVDEDSDAFRTLGRVLGQWTPGYKQDLFGW